MAWLWHKELNSPAWRGTHRYHCHLDIKTTSTNSWVSFMHCSKEFMLFLHLNLKSVSWNHSTHVKSLLVACQFPVCLLCPCNRSFFFWGGGQTTQWPFRHIGKKQVSLRVKVNIESIFKTYNLVQKRVKVERTLLFYALEKPILLLIFQNDGRFLFMETTMVY